MKDVGPNEFDDMVEKELGDPDLIMQPVEAEVLDLKRRLAELEAAHANLLEEFQYLQRTAAQLRKEAGNAGD